MAVVGWILVDQGFRFPGEQYSTSVVANAMSAHDPMVASGNMTILLLSVFILELIGGAAIFGAAAGSGRAPGKSLMTICSRSRCMGMRQDLVYVVASLVSEGE